MRAAETDTSFTDEVRWSRVIELFDELLAGADPTAALAAESDSAVRDTVINLWTHHERADAEDYLGAPMTFEVTTVFQPGQMLLNRFRIEELLGTGGMGEVYLAWDERMEHRVALKTIARLLAPSDSIRRRFIAEVKSARRVTHPNVCRIHELFEEAEVVFFSMEYLEGTPLSDLLEGGLDARRARLIARQTAEALRAAHRTGVVHGDFKPANVMIVAPQGIEPRAVIMDFGLARGLDRAVGSVEEGLSVQAGTLEYMAPELIEGGTPSVRSDIFAWGKVAAHLLPGDNVWMECTRRAPEDRAPSLDKVIRKLEPGSARRYWLTGLAIVGAARFVFWPSGDQPQVHLPPDARVLVNGFRSLTAKLPVTKLARSIVVTALQQTARIHAIADEDLVPLLNRMKLSTGAPLVGRGLDDVLTQLRAAFWIEGELGETGDRYSLDVKLIAAQGRQVVAASVFHDAPNVIELAQSAALWIRKTTGESGQSLAANPTNVESFTSSVPEALQSYYTAMEHYAVADMGQAVPLLQEAIRLDPRFAQAHAMLAMTLNPARYDQAFREIDTAFRLSETLPYRERVSIETNYYRLTGDFAKSIDAATRSVADRPDEPRRHTALGQALGNAGRFEEAVASFRTAVELAPDDWMQIQRLEAGLVELGQFDAALKVFADAIARQVSNKWIYNGAGSAYMGLERYAEALQAFSNEPSHAENTPDMQAPKILEGHLDVAIAAMEEQLANPRVSSRDAFQASEFLCGLYYATDRQAQAIQQVRNMANWPAYPGVAENFASAGSWARRLQDAETLSTVLAKVTEMARRWPNGRTQAVANHVKALQMWSRNALDEAEILLLKSSGAAFSLWTLFDLAEFYTGRAKWDLAEEYWQKFDSHRGTVIAKGWFPGTLVFAWLQRAVAAQGRNDRRTAFASSGKVLEHWSRLNPQLTLVQTAQRINFVSKTS